MFCGDPPTFFVKKNKRRGFGLIPFLAAWNFLLGNYDEPGSESYVYTREL